MQATPPCYRSLSVSLHACGCPWVRQALQIMQKLTPVYCMQGAVCGACNRNTCFRHGLWHGA